MSLVKALSMQSGIPLSKKLDGLDIDSELTIKFQSAFAKKHLILPYEKVRIVRYGAYFQPE
jgi:hypothetical protein